MPAHAAPRPGGAARPPSGRSASAEEVALRSAARAAEDAGDYLGARRLVGQLPAGAERARWAASLDEVLALGTLPAAAPFGRWLLQPALRFGLRPATGGIFTGYAVEVLRAWGHPASQRSRLALDRAAQDPLVVDAGLFDGGVFQRYLREALAPPVRALAGPVARWGERPASAFVVGRKRDGHLVVTDLLVGRPEDVSPTPGLALGQVVYGRLVAGDRLPLFALPPLVIDRLTAGRVVRAVARAAPVAERLRAVALCQRRRTAGPRDLAAG